MDKKILAFDLDGTLLNKEHNITLKTRKIISLLKEMGHYIVIVTGRSYNACKYYSRLIDADYTIACNGAFSYDHHSNEVFNKIPLDTKLSKRILKILFNYQEQLKIQWDSLFTYFSNNITPFEESYIKNYRRDYPDEIFEYKIIKNYKEIEHTSEDIYQIFFHPLGKDYKAYECALESLNEEKDINIIDFSKGYTDINDKKVSKGNSLKYLSNKLSIPRENIIVFGDGDNDISMFKYAGVKIAMENACERLKELSTFVTGHHDEEGVLHALGKLFSMNVYA